MSLRPFAFAVCLLAASGSLLSVRRRHQTRFQYALSGVDTQLPAQLAGTGYTQLRIDSPDNGHLKGLVRPPTSANAPWLVLFPGNAERQLATAIPLLEGMRAGAEMGAAVFAYRGFDGNPGTPSPRAAAADARTVLSQLQARFNLKPAQLVLVGYSMGSGIALRAAAELAARETPAAALLLLSPYYQLDLAPARPLNWLWPTETYTVADVLHSVPEPVLIVGAARDSALPVVLHARPLAAALGSRAQYWELPEAGHADYLQDEALLARVGEFARARAAAP